MSGQLFKLSEYHAAFAKFVYTAIQELMGRKDPFFGQIKAVQTPRPAMVRNTMPSGQIVENEPMSVAMPFAVDFQEAITGNSGSLVASIDSAAEEALKTVMPQLFSYVGRLCQAGGTATDAGGQKLSHRLIRESLAKLQIDFDENGQPIMPTMVMHPEMLKQLEALPPPSEEDVRAWNELMEQKRQEFNDRRRHRKLS